MYLCTCVFMHEGYRERAWRTDCFDIATYRRTFCRSEQQQLRSELFSLTHHPRYGRFLYGRQMVIGVFCVFDSVMVVDELCRVGFCRRPSYQPKQPEPSANDSDLCTFIQLSTPHKTLSLPSSCSNKPAPSTFCSFFAETE